MEFSISAMLFLTFHVTILFSQAISDPRSSEAGLVCSENLYSLVNSAPFVSNLVNAMRLVSDQINRIGFGSANVTSPPPAVTAFGQCHADLTRKDCAACSAAARTKLSRCLPSASGAVYLDGCVLRYGNGTAWEEDGGEVKCGGSVRDGAGEDDGNIRVEFARKVGAAVGALAESAATNGGFGVWIDRGGVEDVYVLAQCWRSVGKEVCRQCLRGVGERLVRECGVGPAAAEGRGMERNCFLRYSTERFFKVEPFQERLSKKFI